MSVVLASSISFFVITSGVYICCHTLYKPVSIHKYVELMDNQNTNPKIDDELI